MTLALILSACSWQPAQIGLGEPEPLLGVDMPDEAEPPPRMVSALLETRSGEVLGSVVFQGTRDQLVMSGRIEGLRPNAAHALHVHEGYRCGDDFKEAGPHFDPDGNPHGEPGADSHAGDLGNIVADADGVAVLDIVTDDLSLDGKDSARARTLVVHAGRDDLQSQPSGAAGDRLACGVIHGDVDSEHPPHPIR